MGYGGFGKRLLFSEAAAKQRPRTPRVYIWRGAPRLLFQLQLTTLASVRSRPSSLSLCPPCLLSVLSASSPPHRLARSLAVLRHAPLLVLRLPPALRLLRHERSRSLRGDSVRVLVSVHSIGQF